MDYELLSLWGTFVHFNFNLLLVSLHLFTLAVLAPLFWVDHLPLTVAVFARSSALGVHAWSHLSHGSLHASSFASFATLNSRGIRTTDSIAPTADSLSLDINQQVFAVVHISKCYLNLLGDWLDSHVLLAWWASSALSAHEHAENIVHTSSATTLLNFFFSVLVIDFSLVLVTEDIVCILNFLELYNIGWINLDLGYLLTFSWFPPLSGWCLTASFL